MRGQKTKSKSNQSKKKILKLTGDVKQHTKTQYTQNFASYQDIYGAEDLDYELIDGLYHSTILNRIIKKVASDAVPEMFKVQIVDIEGKRIPELEKECFRYTAAFKRKHIKEIYLTQLKYGTAFLYIGNKEDDRLTNIYLIHPKYIKPNLSEEGEIESWIYTGNTDAGEIEVPYEDIIRFPYDADIGEIYGMSFCGKLAQTLHLLLNTELNMAEIVDKYAIPILQWLIEVGDDEELQDDELEAIVNSLQNQFEYSNDIVTTDRITTQPIGFADNQYDMESTLASLKESLGLLTFPMSIIGGKADNLSSSKIQAAQYVNDLKDYQMDISDILVESLYEPFLESLGKIPGDDYANIYLVFPTLTMEANSEAATWIFPAIRHGIISRDEARAQFSFRGKALDIDELEFIDSSYIGNQQNNPNDSGDDENQPDDSNNPDNDSPKEPKDKSGKGDPESEE